MPGPFTGLRALAGVGSYAEAFLEPEAAWTDDEPVSDFSYTDRLWWRPRETEPLSDKHIFGFYVGSMYHMNCKRCDTRWLAEANSTPRCWYCGRFVPLNANFKEERQRLRG